MAQDSIDALQKMSLANLRTGERLSAQFNPEELKHSIGVSYAFPDVIGLPHKPDQYTGTDNQTLDFQLYCRADDAREHQIIVDFANFLQALCYPSETASAIVNGAPPRVLFVWPTFMSLTCRVRGIKFRYTQFGTDLRVRKYTADIEIFESRDVRLFAEDVRVSGMRRGSPTSSPR